MPTRSSLGGRTVVQEIQRHQIIAAIDAFLEEQKSKKIEPLQKRLDAAQTTGNNEEIAALNQQIDALHAKYERVHWCTDEAPKMASQLRFGTHISKGIHPDSRGDNVTQDLSPDLPDAIVGSQHLPNVEIDANRSAAALPVASFLAIDIDQGIKLRDVILADHPELHTAFSADADRSFEVQIGFKQALLASRETHQLDEWNKQLLWPSDPHAMEKDAYINLIPLHPSALAHFFNKAVQARRFSDRNKLARESNRKKNEPKSSYLFMPDLGVVHLGGSKPQNISQLNSQILGRNVLLPSLPPSFRPSGHFVIRRKDTTLFTSRLAHSVFCEEGFKQLRKVILLRENNVGIREQRFRAIKAILGGLTEVSSYYQTQQEPGWSRKYALNWSEKLWLDPLRVELEAKEKGGSEAADVFSEREESDWLNKVYEGFGRWVSGQLDTDVALSDEVFGDIHSTQWRRDIEAFAKASQRAGERAFK